MVRQVVVVFGAARVPQAYRRHLPPLPREKTLQFSCTVSHCQVSEMRFALGVSGASEMTRHGGRQNKRKLLWLVADPFYFSQSVIRPFILKP